MNITKHNIEEGPNTMSTTDQTPQPDPASLAASAETLLDEAIDIQGVARGWLAATHESPHVDSSTRDAALETAESIDATVDGLGWSTQALHRTDDPNAPTWQRHAPAPLVTDTEGNLTPTDSIKPDGITATRTGLAGQAHFLAEELDQLGNKVDDLTAASSEWLEAANEHHTDADVLQHGQRANDNLADSLTMCHYTAGRAETFAENLTDTRDTDEQIAQVVDEAEHGLHVVRDYNTGLHQRSCTEPAVDEPATRSNEDAGAEHGRAAEIDTGHEPPF